MQDQSQIAHDIESELVDMDFLCEAATLPMRAPRLDAAVPPQPWWERLDASLHLTVNDVDLVDILDEMEAR